jgi:hypothetical protein
MTLVLHSAFSQIFVGLGLGIPAALFAGHLITGLLYGVSGYDPLAFLGPTMVLGICAAMAGFIPARRAASIDPMRALRTVGYISTLLRPAKQSEAWVGIVRAGLHEYRVTLLAVRSTGYASQIRPTSYRRITR